MKKLIVLLLGLFLFQQGYSQIETIIQVPYTSSPTPTRSALLYLPPGYASSGINYPLLVFNHGAGESLPGTPPGSTLYNNTQSGGPSYVIEHGVWPTSFTNPADGLQYQFIVVSPFSANGWSFSGDELEFLYKYLVTTYRVDVTRLYQTGLSAGGAGGVEYAAHMNADENALTSTRTWKLAAFVPMSEASNQPQQSWCNIIVADSVRAWGFGNFADVHGAITSDLITLMNNVKPLGRFSVYTQGSAGGGHCCWNTFYDPGYRESFTWKGPTGVNVTSNMNIYEWLLINKRLSTSSTTANAGSPQTITLPTSQVTLVGSGTPSAGHTIASYAWTKQSGPAAGVIVSPSSSTTNVTSLTISGTYVYLLTVTDNVGGFGTSTVAIQVNDNFHPAPTVVVTSPQTVSLPTSGVPLVITPTLTGTLQSASWTKYPVNQPKIKVAILGSSTSVGTGATTEDSAYVNRLAAFWISQGIVDSVINLALGGANPGIALATGTTPPSGLSAPDPIRNVTAIINSHPGTKVVIVNFPTNDYDQTVVSPTVVGQTLQAIYNSLGAAGIQCYVTTTQSRVDFSQAVQDKLQVIRDTILNRFGYHAINFYQGLTTPGTTQQIPQYAAGDGIHFNDAGHRNLFEFVKAKNIFQDLVTKTSTVGSPTNTTTLITGLDTGVHKYNGSIVDGNGLMASAMTTITVNPAPVGSCGGHKTVVNPDPVDSSFFIDGAGIYNPGDTILLNDGGKAFQNVVFVDLNGTPSCPIVIMNDPALGRQCNFTGATAQLALGNCNYVHVTGTGVNGVTYGIHMDGYPGNWTAASAGGSYFAYVTSGRSSNIEWDHLYCRHAAVGFEVKQDGDCDSNYIYPNWVMDSIIIHHNNITTIWNEGMYIGNTSPDNGPTSYDPRPVDCDGVTTYPKPIRVGYIHVYNNIVDSTGRGGIQFASGDGSAMECDHNTVSHNGWSGDDAQGTAISCGTYTWPYIHDNIINCTFTWGIANVGGGFTNHPIRIENNTIDSSGYMQYYIDPVAYTLGANTLQWPVAIEITTKPVDSLPALDSTQFYIKNNKIGKFKNIDGYAIALDDVYVRMQKSGNIICSNTALNGTTPVTTVYNNGNNPAIPFTTSCAGAPNLSASGSPLTLVLPSNSSTLTALASANTGTIVSYAWTKLSGTGGTITSPSASVTTVTGLTAGTYVYQVVVTDSNSLTNTATVTINVTAISNYVIEKGKRIIISN